jgi:type I restriction enzyme M protein
MAYPWYLYSFDDDSREISMATVDATQTSQADKYQILPPLDPETYEALKANISIHGIKVPIVKDEAGLILDGFARARIAEELGYECPESIESGLSEADKRALVRALNLSRRQLGQSAKREVIAGQLRETPRLSNRRIARVLGVDHKTVVSVRASMTGTGEIPQFDRLVSQDDKERPAQSEAIPISSRSYVSRPDNYVLKVKPNIIETPAGVARFLFDLISPEYPVRTILDPCSGRGALTRPWAKRRVIDFEIAEGKDFFAGPDHIDCDLVLCNPPFNSGEEYARLLLPERFLARIVDVVRPGTPIALFAPMGLRLNCVKGARRYRWLRDECPPITSIISLPRDIFPGCEFHSEILLFNMPKLGPHHLLPDEYLDAGSP